MLETIAAVATYTNNKKHLASLQHHADKILQDSSEGLSQEEDRKDLQKQYQRVIKAFLANSTTKNWD